MSEQFPKIDFDDETLVRFRRVDSPNDLQGFTSDIDEFNDYIGPAMVFDLENSITRIYRMEIAGLVAGYVDLAMAHLRKNDTPEIEAKGIESNVPALLISRLAVDVTFQGHGVGRKMIHRILDGLVPKLKKISGCRYLILHPRDDEGVRNFYKNLNFVYYKKLKDGEESDMRKSAFLFDLNSIKEEADD